MTFSVYGVELALWTVSDQAGLLRAGSTSGQRLAKTQTGTSRAVTALAANASPSRPRTAASTARPNATTMVTATTPETALPRIEAVHARNATAATPVTGASHGSRRAAASCTAPPVRSVR